MAFFEGLGKRLTDTGQNVAQQTKNFAEITQINSAISDIEKKILHFFSIIGQEYYERHKSDELSEERELIETVNNLYIEISEKREKIKLIKGVITCESCGADVPLNAFFCNSCGAQVIREESHKNDTRKKRVCPVCNELEYEDNLFCTHCGAKIEMDAE